MLFNFELTPIHAVQPWGTSLDWYGLSFGEYWLQVGDEALFEYSGEARAALGVARYCDYQVGRLHEDVLDMYWSVLEPVPGDLVTYLDFAHTDRWNALVWPPGANRSMLDVWADADYPLVRAATWWATQRTLDSAYLTPPARIRLWSQGEDVCVGWDNTGATIGGVRAWTTTRGRIRMPREVFVAEVRAFHDRLMAAMAERTRTVVADGLPGVTVDVAQLVREHAAWSGTLDKVLAGPPPPTEWEPATDWGEVRTAIRALEARSASA